MSVCWWLCVDVSVGQWCCGDVCVTVMVWWRLCVDDRVCVKPLRGPKRQRAHQLKSSAYDVPRLPHELQCTCAKSDACHTKQQPDASNAAPAMRNHPAPKSGNARTSWSHGVMMSWWYCWCDDAWYGGCRDVCVIAICIVTMWCADGRATDGGEGGGGRGGKGEAGDAAPKIRTPHGDVGKNRLKYQHLGCKLQPFEATYVSSCWRPSVRYNLFFLCNLGPGDPCWYVHHAVHKSCDRFWGSRTIKSCWMILNCHYLQPYLLNY